MMGRRKEETKDEHKLTWQRRIMESWLVFALELRCLFLWLLHSLTHNMRLIITASMYLSSLYLEISI